MQNLMFSEKELYRLANPPARTQDLTPIETHAGILVKRDDAFAIGGLRGGKARTCWHLAQGAKGLVTSGWFGSPQVQIVAHIARYLGIPCRGYVPGNKEMNGRPIADDPSVPVAEALGMEVIRAASWALGYKTNLTRCAQRYAAESGWKEIPFGMECDTAVNQTRQQVENLPDAKRIVVPVGSGMSLAGVLWGLRDCNRNVPVLGVVVGSDPTARIDKYSPHGWQETATLIKSSMPYAQAASSCTLGSLSLDPHYEAKCLPFLQPGDLFWVVGLRNP